MASKVRFILLVCIVLVFMSCAATRKSTIHATHISGDSISVVQKDSVYLIVLNKDSAEQFISVEQKKEETFAEDSDGLEVISEQIVDHYDSAGNRTTITNRVTKRRNTFSKQATLFDYQRYANHEINTMFSFMDSAIVSQNSLLTYHSQLTDSLNQQSVPSSSEKTSIWSIVKAFIVLTMVVVFEYAIFSLYHFLRSKKDD